MLHDFLRATNFTFRIYVPQKSSFEDICRKDFSSKHIIRTFRSALKLYLLIAFHLIFHKAHVYCNEGGHIRYLKLLSRVFPNRRFTVHLRILEDTIKERIEPQINNISYICISDFIQRHISISTEKIYDPFPWSNSVKDNKFSRDNRFKISILGRISKSKGIGLAFEFLSFLEKEKFADHWEFHFYGGSDVNNKNINQILADLRKLKKVSIYIHPFTPRTEISMNSDAYLHFSVNEPLGRVFLEAIDEGKPFIGFNSGGIGEIGSMVGLSEHLVDYKDSQWYREMADLLHSATSAYENWKARILAAKSKAKGVFSVETYTMQLEKIITNS